MGTIAELRRAVRVRWRGKDLVCTLRGRDTGTTHVLVASTGAPYIRRLITYRQQDAAASQQKTRSRGVAAYIPQSRGRGQLQLLPEPGTERSLTVRTIQQDMGKTQYPELEAIRCRPEGELGREPSEPGGLDPRWETVVRSKSVTELVGWLQAFRHQDKIYGEYERLVVGLGELVFRERGLRAAMEFHMRLNTRRVASGDEPIPYDLASYARRLPRTGEDGPEGDGPDAA